MNDRAIVRAAEAKSLWDDPDGVTCPVVPLYRHPLYRSLRPICYSGFPLWFFLCVFFGSEGLTVFFSTTGAFLALVAGSLLVSTQHGKAAGVRRQVGRLARGYRFLCPRCLCFGRFRYSCGACGEELEEFVIHTRGWYLNDCPYCRAPVFPRYLRRGNEPGAYCAACGDVGNLAYHERVVRILGALHPDDFQRLSRLLGGAPAEADVPFAWRDEGESVTYLLDLSGASEAALPRDHGGREVSAVWIGSGGRAPLTFGQALDRLVWRCELSEARRKNLLLCVEAPALDAAGANLLESRFGNVRYGVPAEEFVRPAAPRADRGNDPGRIAEVRQTGS